MLIKTIIKQKISYYVLVAVIFMVLVDFFISGHDLAQEKYGINIWIFLYIFFISEVFFNLGIYLILKGSGFFRIRIKDILHFKLSGVTTKHPLVYYGFFINRVAAIAPWLYVLGVGYKKLPIYISLLILAEVLIVLYIGYVINARINFSIWKKLVK